MIRKCYKFYTLRQDMQLEEISLDCVIMSPEMLEPVPAR